MNNFQKLKQGYAHLLDVLEECFDRPGFTLIETPARDRPEWANWVTPIWVVSLGSGAVCSVSPRYKELAKTIFETATPNDLLSPTLLKKAYSLMNKAGWGQREILFYASQKPLPCITPSQVEQLHSSEKKAHGLLKSFDGGVYAIRNHEGDIISWAGIKNKGIINEIAVETQPDYQQHGMGKAVVAEAVNDIITRGNIPVYIPDTLDNAASYALARSLDFQKIGNEVYWEYTLQNWKGFPLNVRKT